jgi:hypothetical protein
MEEREWKKDRIEREKMKRLNLRKAMWNWEWKKKNGKRECKDNKWKEKMEK